MSPVVVGEVEEGERDVWRPMARCWGVIACCVWGVVGCHQLDRLSQRDSLTAPTRTQSSDSFGNERSRDPAIQEQLITLDRAQHADPRAVFYQSHMQPQPQGPELNSVSEESIRESPANHGGSRGKNSPDVGSLTEPSEVIVSGYDAQIHDDDPAFQRLVDLRASLQRDVGRDPSNITKFGSHSFVKARVAALMQRAQAMIRLGRWQDALGSAQRAVELSQGAGLIYLPTEQRPEDFLRELEQSYSLGAWSSEHPEQKLSPIAPTRNIPEQDQTISAGSWGQVAEPDDESAHLTDSRETPLNKQTPQEETGQGLTPNVRERESAALPLQPNGGENIHASRLANLKHVPEGNYSTKTHRQHRAVLIPNPLTSLPSELETISQTHIHEGQQAESLNEELKAPEIIPLEQSKFEQSNKVKVTIHEGQRHDERLANDSNRRESRSENGIITTWADRIFPVLLIGSCLPVVTGLIVRGWIISLRVNSRRVNKPLAPKL